MVTAIMSQYAAMPSPGSALPTGTVTFLFTDIVGSTPLWEHEPEKMAVALKIHNAALRRAIEAHSGVVFKVVGDAFQAVFPTALQALEAAVNGQKALQSAPWNDLGPLAVRMGLHTGDAVLDPESDEYTISHTKNRAARIMSAAHGGQILLSQETTHLVDRQLPAEVTLKDLGEHSLKGMSILEHLYQASAAGLAQAFPPLATSVTPRHNLPLQLTTFIDREIEIVELRGLLEKNRLVTLTGSGGTGKTRLALQVASESLEHFRDGVFFVALAPINDPGLVASTIAQPLGITESAGRSILDCLVDDIKNKSMLILLDNFEQVISAAPLISELLGKCSQVKFLVTSRAGLHITGESEYPLSPLPVPDLQHLPPESLSHNAAVQLFIQRAQAVKPGFKITSDTAQAVAEICYRLDGLPLAIELAAARIRLLPPHAMLARLEHRLEFLTGGARDLPARQQTLRNAIDWSYDLLSEDEQKMFRRLSVFVGGCTIEAVEEVAGDGAEHFTILDQLGSLLDKSLLREVEGIENEPRFVMMEMLREYGLEQLEASGEMETIRHRHAFFFLALAEQTEARLEGADQLQWVSRMEQEHDNLRAALDWSLSEDCAVDFCLRFAASLGLFWEARGHFSEGRERLSAVIQTKAAQGPTAARARILARAAELAYRQSDYPATTAFAGESLAICHQIGDRQGAASALIKLGNAATEIGNYQSARDLLEEALAIWCELDDKHGTARALISLGWAALRPGDFQLANQRLEEALAISRALGDSRSIGFELSGLGEVALRQGDYKRATQLLEESLEMRRQHGNKWGVGVSLGTLGWAAMHELDWNRAVARLLESLEVRQEIGDRGGSAWCLERLAEVALAQHQAEMAVRLFASAEALRLSIGSVIDPADQHEYENKLTALRLELGEQRFDAIWNEGRSLVLDQAIELVQEMSYA